MSKLGELPLTLTCPYCGFDKSAVLRRRNETYHGKTYMHYFYRCVKCLEEFTTTESDNETLAPFFPSWKRKQMVLEIIKTIKYKKWLKK